MKILGIETSCDETAVAVVKDGREVLSSEIFSQIQTHASWGGVIPELASRLHLEVINQLVHQALQNSKLTISEIDAIAFTQGPGLLGSLMVGVHCAKTLAWIHKKPLIAVNHLYGHICANFIDTKLEPPLLCMLVSGGHTQIIAMHNYTEIEILGETIDDAAGEAFDKVARLLDLDYPGGPHLDKLAQSASDTKCSHELKAKAIVNACYRFPVARVDELDFSFSGLKTSVLRLKQALPEAIWQQDRAKIALAFQNCVAQTLLAKMQEAAKRTNYKQIVIAGGVAANSKVRSSFSEYFSQANNYQLILPSLKYCTDNAAMIAAAAYFQNKYKKDQQQNPFTAHAFSRGE